MKFKDFTVHAGSVMLILLLMMIIVLVSPTAVSAGESGDKPVPQSLGEVISCRLLPADNIWNTPIDTLPVDTNSNLYIQTIGASQTLHPDFGSGTWEGAPIGIPFITVPGNQEKVAVTFDYDDESDPGPYPIPPDAPIEGGSSSTGDRHVLVVDRTNCILYELFDAHPQGDGTWTAGSGAIYDLKSNALRPNGWTSADAAGLPILPGLVRYEEVAAGEIKHAIRFTAPQTRRAYVWPARHYASSLTGSQYPPMGQRFRLKAGFDTSGYAPHARVILEAMKKYGIILADNGSSWFISGAPDERWNNDVLRQLKQVRGSDFEAVDVSALMVSPNSGQVVQPQLTKSIVVTAPRAGDRWQRGTSYFIRWTSTGSIANVDIQLLYKNKIVYTFVSSTPNDGKHLWTVPAGATTGSDFKIKILDASDRNVYGDSGIFEITKTAVGEKPEIWLNRTRINAGAIYSGSTSRAQRFLIRNSGNGTLRWSLSDDSSWLKTSPSSGTGSRFVSVTVDASGLEAGNYTGTITVRDDNAGNSPQEITVKLAVILAGVNKPPIGLFELPGEGATIRGSVAVTGWALDDVEVENVTIYLKQGANYSRIGTAVLVEGARPDVERAYPDYPFHYQAGWGYMMLSNYLPNNGNGTFQLVAIARDGTGKETVLGSRTIHADNANGTKPFGAIDTPYQGGEASGNGFFNWGWVLTPQPKHIPEDGSTIGVFIDGEFVGRPVYNLYRADIARYFPGYANTGGAVGYFLMDTTKYDDGVHTVQWTVTDSGGQTDGIGSRFFVVYNGGAERQKRNLGDLAVSYHDPRAVRRSPFSVGVFKGWGSIEERGNRRIFKEGTCETVFPGEDGKITVEIRELQRLVIDLENRHPDGQSFAAGTVEKSEPLPRFKGYMRFGNQKRPLPAGSSLKSGQGIFYWQPGPGFVGTYPLVFLSVNPDGSADRRDIVVRILPRMER